jgi:hypothetical protein
MLKHLLILLIFTLVPLPALADAAAGYVINIQESLQLATSFIFAALGTVIVWAAGLVVKKLKLENDSEIRFYLEQAIHAGLAWALRKAQVAVSEVKDPRVESQIVADAANYIADRVPDALAHFGITPESLAEMIRARLPQHDGGASGPAVAQ